MIEMYIALAITSAFFSAELLWLLGIWLALDACGNILEIMFRFILKRPYQKENNSSSIKNLEAENVQWLNKLIEVIYKKFVVKWIKTEFKSFINVSLSKAKHTIYVKHLDIGTKSPEITYVYTNFNRHSKFFDLGFKIKLNSNVQICWSYPFLLFGLKSMEFCGVIRLQMKLLPDHRILESMRISLTENSQLNYEFTHLASVCNIMKPILRSIFKKTFVGEVYQFRFRDEVRMDPFERLTPDHIANTFMVKIIQSKSTKSIQPRVLLQLIGEDFFYHSNTGFRSHYWKFNDIIVIPFKNINDKLIIKLVDCDCDPNIVKECVTNWSSCLTCIKHEDKTVAKTYLKLAQIKPMDQRLLNLDPTTFGRFEIFVQWKVIWSQ